MRQPLWKCILICCLKLLNGEGNSAKLVSDIVTTATQVSEGMNESIGIDLKSLLAGFLGGKIATSDHDDTDDKNDKRK